MTQPTIEIFPYLAEFGLETVKMMRQSLHTAMSVKHHNKFGDVSSHLNFFSKNDPKYVQVAIDTQSTDIIGCMVLEGSELDQLYVHVDYQRNGIGGQFIKFAKEQSPSGLELYTFQLNTQAQAFYKKHGFVEKARGVASLNDNPWAENAEQLADVRFVWLPD